MSPSLDKSTWKRVAFGDAIESVTERVDDPSAAGVDRYVGLEHLDPGVMTVQRWDSPDKVSAQKLRFVSGDVIFGRRRAYQKKVAKAEFEGICSAHALVLRARPELVDPDFLPVFLSSNYFLDRAIGISVGSLSPTINWRDLRVQEFDLPTLDEQKRIADLMWAMERHRATVHTERESASQALGRFAAHRLYQLPDTIRLGDVTTTRSGPSFAASSVHESAVEGSVPVMGIPNTKPDGTMDLAGVGHVTGLPDSVGRVDDASLVLIRTNGNRDRIGNVYIPPAEANGYAVSAFQFLMRATDPKDREYLYWVLKEPSMQGRMSDGASGSVGLGNLAARWLNEQQIPWAASQAERLDVVTDIETVSEALAALDCELASLSALRSSLITDIFGGN